MLIPVLPNCKLRDKVALRHETWVGVKSQGQDKPQPVVVNPFCSFILLSPTFLSCLWALGSPPLPLHSALSVRLHSLLLGSDP